LKSRFTERVVECGGETLEQLDELVVTLGASVGPVMKSSISRSANWLFTTRKGTDEVLAARAI
jgi:hypothetical protein